MNRSRHTKIFFKQKFFENKQCEKHVPIPIRLITSKPSIESNPHLGCKDLKYLEPKIFLEPKLVGPFFPKYVC